LYRLETKIDINSKEFKINKEDYLKLLNNYFLELRQARLRVFRRIRKILTLETTQY